MAGLAQPETVEVNGLPYCKEPAAPMRASKALDELTTLYFAATGAPMPQNVEVAGAAVKSRLEDLNRWLQENRKTIEKCKNEIADLIQRNKQAADDIVMLSDRAIEARQAYERKDAVQVRRIQELEADNKRLQLLVDSQMAANDLKRQQLNALRSQLMMMHGH